MPDFFFSIKQQLHGKIADFSFVHYTFISCQELS